MEIGSPEWKKTIINGAKAINIQVDDVAANLFAIHGRELVRWARKTNLTAITDPYEVAIKHFLDSISAVPFIPSDSSVLDMGSGGGFPGLPLKIVTPGLFVTLIDGSRKKISFLNHVIRILNLHRTEAMQIRAEEMAEKQKFFNAFDVIICRAFSNLARFVEKALPLMAAGGKLIAMRGRITDEDISTLHAQSLPYRIHRYQLPYIDAERSLVILE